MPELAKQRVIYTKNKQATAATRSICLTLRCQTAPRKYKYRQQVH